jgi:hypothetical protein
MRAVAAHMRAVAAHMRAVAAHMRAVAEVPTRELGRYGGARSAASSTVPSAR